MRTLATQLSKRTARLVQVESAIYVPMTVQATITLVEAPGPEAVADVEECVFRFLHPLVGGETADGWPFGRTVHASDVAAAIEALPDVQGVTALSVCDVNLALSRLGAERRAIHLPANGLPFGYRHDLVFQP